MAIQPETPWTKTNQATKAVRPKSDNLDIPIGERLTRFRTEQQGEELKNKFERKAAVKTEIPLDDEIRLNIFDRQAPAKIRIQTRTRTSRTLEDPQLTQARLNEESRRLALKNPPKGPANFSYSDADWAAILQGWKARHSADYVPTPFNGHNLGRMIAHQCAIGQLEWNSESLTVCHQWLAEHGYYEAAEGQRKRGQAAPKESWRICRATVSPSMSGRLRSNIAISGFRTTVCSKASQPDFTSQISQDGYKLARRFFMRLRTI
jgi:hypothetical protein